ncbi:MAG: hypothetical protein WBC18_07810 [Ottowia sp.]|uniref:hypothetical protein n=1 Tax=Ottowia sp. TaxID=1898956 RepID=UPI003C74718D
MKPIVFAVIILAVAVAAIILASRSGSDSKPSNRPLFGYYGCFGNQVAEVADHTNLHWEAFWDGLQKGIDNIRTAAKFTVIDVGSQLFEGAAPKTFRPDAEARLRSLFNDLQNAGVLHLVKMIVPMDEPNLPENRACADLPEAVGAIRALALSYPELSGVLLGCIYYNGAPKCHTDLFDVVGFDDYEPGANILSPNGAYEKFRETLRPGQRTMLIPGGGYGPSKWEPKQQDPVPFVSYAMSNPEVLMIVPFLWRYPAHGGDMVGIVDLPVKDAYIAAGKSILEAA